MGVPTYFRSPADFVASIAFDESRTEKRTRLSGGACVMFSASNMGVEVVVGISEEVASGAMAGGIESSHEGRAKTV